MFVRSTQPLSRLMQRAAVALVASAAVASSASAANILRNSEFSDFTVSPWISGTGFSLLLSNLDHNNNTGSGSMRWSQIAGTNLGTSVFSECEPIGGSQAISAGGYFRTAGAAPSGAKVQIQVRYFSGVGCTSWISTQKSGFLTLGGSWGQAKTDQTTPSNAKSVQVQIDTQDTVLPADAYDIVADGIFLNAGAAGSPNPIFASNFNSGTLTDWIVVDR